MSIQFSKVLHKVTTKREKGTNLIASVTPLLHKILDTQNPCFVIEEEMNSFAYWLEVSRDTLANQDHEHKTDRPTSLDKALSN